MNKDIQGFSKLSKEEKIEWLVNTYFNDHHDAVKILKQYWNNNKSLQKLHDEFIENTISNFYLPFAVAPNFLINNKTYAIPMAIEESSVVAAAGKAAKFWKDRGGFKAEVIATEKIGQVHFMFNGNKEKLYSFFKKIKATLIKSTASITKNMEKRGGGILDIQLIDKTEKLGYYYQLHCTFETLDAMGANFINSCLEQFSKTLLEEAKNEVSFSDNEKEIQIVMSILSNYVPNCIVKAEVSCPVKDLTQGKELNSSEFADKFVRAVQIAQVEPHRAVTHNKGIMNGIDAVVLATGNDFRAVEAGVHAYASRNGSYSSLTNAKVDNGVFKFWIEIPLALGTIGGLTAIHPLVKLALQMLENPNAKELMKIVAVAGLAQNFAALRSLITTGIQKGHMKMHLMNILNQLKANDKEKAYFINYYKDKTVSHSEVVNAFNTMRTSTSK